jgi:hypothetical protein
MSFGLIPCRCEAPSALSNFALVIRARQIPDSVRTSDVAVDCCPWLACHRCAEAKYLLSFPQWLSEREARLSTPGFQRPSPRLRPSSHEMLVPCTTPEISLPR